MQTQQQPHHVSTLQLPLSTIIRLILQFLQQQKLTHTFKTLQQQSKTSLNIINKFQIEAIFNQCNWQQLFKQLNYLSLSQDLLFDLYQFIIDDLIDKDYFQAAKFVIKKCVIDGGLMENNKQRLLRMEYICQNTSQKAMYHKPPSKTRKQTLITRILRQTYQQVQKSRLLTLITSALKQQNTKGLITPNLSYSLLQGQHKNIQNQSQQLITKIDKILRYTQQSRITALSISNKGQYIALGGIDGLIQIYEPIDYTLDTNTLKYQAQGIMLFHQHSIKNMIFNQTDQMLLSTDQNNVIKIWNMQNGRLLRKIENQTNIGCINWGIDSSQILIGYQNVQLWGIRGCNLLKQYICTTNNNNNNQQYLLNIYTNSNNIQGNKLYIFGQLGTIRIFNYKTQQQINTIHINTPSNNYGHIIKTIYKNKNINNISLNSANDCQFYIVTNKFVIIINQMLEIVNRYQITGSGDSIQLVNLAVMNYYVYQCVKKQKLSNLSSMIKGKDKDKDKQEFIMQVRDRKTGRIVHTKEIQSQITIIEMHPWRNLLIAYGINQTLSFWRP